MSEPLDQLRSQRELLAQRLAQLDAEIAASAKPAEGPSANATESGVRGDSLADASTALAQAQAEAYEATKRAKFGCWILFGTALGGLLLAVGIWFVTR